MSVIFFYENIWDETFFSFLLDICQNSRRDEHMHQNLEVYCFYFEMRTNPVPMLQA